jgi:hypothetical protein
LVFGGTQGDSDATGAAVSGVDTRLGYRCRYGVPETNLADSPSSSSGALALAMNYLKSMRDDRYRPADIAEVEQKVSLLNEPVHDEVIELRPGQSAASLYALLVGLRNQAQALLERLETRGVYVPSAGQREVVRALYVATRNQVRALAACLELEGLE